MRKVELYPTRPIKGQSFKGAVKSVVPNQSMTLKEVLRRFVRRESLPISKEGSYNEGEYDLEKLDKEDMVVKHEVLEKVTADVNRHRQKIKEFEAEEEARKAEAKKAEKGSGDKPDLPKQP